MNFTSAKMSGNMPQKKFTKPEETIKHHSWWVSESFLWSQSNVLACGFPKLLCGIQQASASLFKFHPFPFIMLVWQIAHLFLPKHFVLPVLFLFYCLLTPLQSKFHKVRIAYVVHYRKPPTTYSKMTRVQRR